MLLTLHARPRRNPGTDHMYSLSASRGATNPRVRAASAVARDTAEQLASAASRTRALRGCVEPHGADGLSVGRESSRRRNFGERKHFENHLLRWSPMDDGFVVIASTEVGLCSGRHPTDGHAAPRVHRRQDIRERTCSRRSGDIVSSIQRSTSRRRVGEEVAA